MPRDPQVSIRASSRRQLVGLFCGAAVMAAAFGILSGNVWHANHPVALDRLATDLGLAAGEVGEHAPMAERVEQLGSREGVGLAAVALALFAVIWRDWVAAVVVVLAPMACFVITQYVAKPLINEPIPFGGRAFPSGHAAGVTAVALTAVLLLYRRWGGLVAILFAPLGIAAVLGVGSAVLTLRFHHYPTDVLGGAALGAAVVLTLAAVLSLARHRWQPGGQWSRREQHAVIHIPKNRSGAAPP